MLQYLLTTEKKSAPLIRNKNYNNKWDTTTFSKLLNYERPENYIVTNTNLSIYNLSATDFKK